MLAEMIEQAERTALQGHKRLRGDTDELDQDMKAQKRAMDLLAARVQKIEDTPPSAERLTFSWQVIASMLAGCAMVVGSFWAVHASVSSLEQTVKGEVALQNERLDELKSSTDDLKKNMEMRRIEIQQLRDIVTAKGR